MYNNNWGRNQINPFLKSFGNNQDNFSSSRLGNFDRGGNSQDFSSRFSTFGSFLNGTPSDPLKIGCGELRVVDENKFVELTGRYSKRMVGRFCDLKDRTGHIQLVIEEKDPKLGRRFAKIPDDAIITVVGTVYLRPNRSVNETSKTGAIEVYVEDILNVNTSKVYRAKKRTHQDMEENGSNTTVTSTEYKLCRSDSILKWFENRDITCNDLTLKNVGEEVHLVGWIQKLTKSKFQQLKDGHGQTQIVLEMKELREIVETLPLCTVMAVRGKVLARPKANINIVFPTGEIEVHVHEIIILDPEEPYFGPIKEKKICKMSLEDAMDNGDEINGNNDANSSKIEKVANTNKFTKRTHTCGELRPIHINENVVLLGWLEFMRMNKFVILRDGYGQTQVMLNENVQLPEDIALESIIRVTGKVVPRPNSMKNPAMETGEIEVIAETVEVINPSKKNLPIEVRNFNRAQENLRLKHRYIDLRFSDMQKNLRTRSKVLMKMREYLINFLGFIEVETPTLFRRTPGGAQEFVVPTRNPGHFYSLVQSPQQFKQMLMAGAIDRYFQIARCYRDEATRPDRQPEFTQLDIELSFTSRDDILTLIEEVLYYSWPNELSKFSIPFPRMSYEEAMSTYGTDKPDLRFDMKMQDLTDVISKNENLTKNIENFKAYAIHCKSEEACFGAALKRDFDKIAEEYKESKFIFFKFSDRNNFIKSFSKLLTAEICDEILKRLNFELKDVVMLAFGPSTQTQELLGKLRLEYRTILENEKIVEKRSTKNFNFVWIIDFPLFSYNDELKCWECVHHPFTAPIGEDVEKLNRPEEYHIIKSQAYDLVLNGQEVGGGSIRIHNKEMQKHVLDEILKIDHSHLEHLLNALESGCPPHGGIALGIDRLMSIICNTKTIRDVIAFPKSTNGKDLLSRAPVPISDEEKQMYHLAIINEEVVKLETSEE